MQLDKLNRGARNGRKTLHRLHGPALVALLLAVFVVPELVVAQTFDNPWEVTPDFTGAWQVGDAIVGIGAGSNSWGGFRPGDWLIARPNDPNAPSSLTVEGIAVRDTVSPGYPIDPSVDGFASGCVVDPADGSLWTTNSADTISHFSGTPPIGTPPATIRDVLSRIDTSGFSPPAPESIGLTPAIGVEPAQVWAGFFDSIFFDPDGALRSWSLPHMTDDPVYSMHVPPVDLFGIYEFDIAADGETVFYTSFANTIRTYNIQTGATTVFATVPTPEENYNLRILPPGIYDPVTNTLEGGLIVATNPRFYRLDENGEEITVYTPGSGNPDVPVVDFWYFAVALTPDAQKFWGASYTDGDAKHGYLYLVDIATGEVELTLDLGLDGAWGLCVYREYLAATTDAATGCLDSQGLSIPCVAPEACNTPLIDEDGDGLLDANDPDCVLAEVVEVCGNNLDEDADGIVAPCDLDHVEGQVIAGIDVDFSPASAEPDWTYTITSDPPTTTGVPDGLGFDSSGHVVPTGADPFPTISYEAALSGTRAPTVYEVTVSVDRGPAPDGTPRTVDHTFNWSVTNTNRVAELTNQPLDRVDLENEDVTLVPGLQPAFGLDLDCGEPVVLDEDCAGLAYALNASSTLPEVLTVDPTTGIVSGTISTTAFDDQPPDGPPTGLYDVTIDIEELVPAPGGGTSIENVIMTEPFDWQVLDGPNLAPLLTSPGDQDDDEGELVNVSLVATDPDPADSLTFSAADLPAGLAVNGTTIEGTLADASVGIHIVTVTVEDDGDPVASDVAVITWTVHDVNNPPVLDPIGDQTDSEGATIDLLVTASDPDAADTLTFDVQNLPPSLTWSQTGPGEVTIQGELTAASSVVVQVSVTDDGDPNETTTDSFTWSVTGDNEPPICVDAIPVPDLLWPSNKRLRNIELTGITDPDGDDTFTLVVDTITQDEPVHVPNPRFAPDGFGVGTATPRVRAERIGSRRRGGGNGRVYQIGFTATDDGGLSCSGTVQVAVPHHRNRPAIDDAPPSFDSTVTPDRRPGSRSSSKSRSRSRRSRDSDSDSDDRDRDRRSKSRDSRDSDDDDRERRGRGRRSR